jgi:hypothetical protein
MPTVSCQTDMIVEKKSQHRFMIHHKVKDDEYKKGYKDGTNESANNAFYDERRLLAIIEKLQIENELLRNVKSQDSA